ncbi:MAG: hypothetical protein JXQ74_02715 [Alphaproteobacteria bacterium]|nr:hypothetical protein [Alphaproteobacteria bacterium]
MKIILLLVCVGSFFISCRPQQEILLKSSLLPGTEIIQVVNDTALKIRVVKPTHLFLDIPFSNPYMDGETVEGIGYKISLKNGMHICTRIHLEHPERVHTINTMNVQYALTDPCGWHHFQYFLPGQEVAKGEPPIQ